MITSRNVKRKLKVIFVAGNLRTNGPNIQLYYLISNLDREKFTPVVFVTTSTREQTEIESRFRCSGVEVISVGGGKLRSMVEGPLRLWRLGRKLSPLVVHPYGFRSDIICALAGARPRLGNVQNNLFHNFQQIFGSRLGRLIAAIDLFILRRADDIITCATSVKNDLQRHGLSSVAIRNSIDPEIYRSLMCSESVSENPEHATPTYLTVGSAIPGKNVEFLVREFANMPKRARHLVVIGHVKEKLISTYDSHPNITFCGHVEKPGDALLKSHYFISASKHEGMPNAVLEALSLGRPIVLSAIPPHLELLDTVGPGLGRSFTWTSESLNAAVTSIEAVSYGALSANCAHTARLKLSAHEMARQYEAVYIDLAKRYGLSVGL